LRIPCLNNQNCDVSVWNFVIRTNQTDTLKNKNNIIHEMKWQCQWTNIIKTNKLWDKYQTSLRHVTFLKKINWKTIFGKRNSNQQINNLYAYQLDLCISNACGPYPLAFLRQQKMFTIWHFSVTAIFFRNADNALNLDKNVELPTPHESNNEIVTTPRPEIKRKKNPHLHLLLSNSSVKL